MTTSTKKSYSELVKLDSFEDRYNYLKLSGFVGEKTFGSKRYLNQTLYRSNEWKKFRNEVILRDSGCDLGIPGREIHSRKNIYIHHLNPITQEQILNRDPAIFDLDNVICTTFVTHSAIHYGDVDSLVRDPVERKPGDTCPWR